jgi:hypothetical protein
MFTLPTLTVDDLPMRLDGMGMLTFCRPNDEAIFASFALGIRADKKGEWEISDIHVGTQRLSGPALGHFIRQFEAKKSGMISDHVAEHLGDAKVAAEFDAMPSHKRAG